MGQLFFTLPYVNFIMPGVCVFNINTHVFVCGLVGANQVGVEAWEAHYGPDREKTHHHLQHSSARS